MACHLNQRPDLTDTDPFDGRTNVRAGASLRDKSGIDGVWHDDSPDD
ncbi:hypothetical protein GCM10011352_20810 [Marinobacterium zhoushanense]|uniref:Uncharacterized protein n=1 Tax=Marinobacterium zhoushanense TaxID=1679163 RepID=A0ABQ1KFJ5_9GAMM|nr:hypothetical protein GCM10011352_20810 [Marinobacterium zhoushanense]